MAPRIKVDEAKFRLLWNSSTPVTQIAAELRITTDAVNRVRVKLDLPARTPLTRAKPSSVPYRDPTPEEIAQRAAAIRATWDAETEERRRVTKSNRGPYEFPVVSVSSIDDAMRETI